MTKNLVQIVPIFDYEPQLAGQSEYLIHQNV